MAILDLSAGLCNIGHATGTEVVELGVGGRFVIAFLVCGGEHLFIGRNHIIFQFAHGLEIHSRYFVECAASLAERVLGRTFQRFAVLVEVRAEHGQGGQFCKGIEEGGAEAGQYVEVAAAGLNEGEEAASVHALAASEDGIQIGQVVDDEVQGLQTSVSGGIHEIDHSYIVLFDEADDVRLCEFLAWLAQEGHQLVRIHFKFFVHCCIFLIIILNST